jgi:hypothetical protein
MNRPRLRYARRAITVPPELPPEPQFCGAVETTDSSLTCWPLL